MKHLFSALIFSILFVPLNAQWYSFDLGEIDVDNFKKEAAPLVRAISLSSVNHLFDQTNLSNRLRLGVAYSHGINISGENLSDLFGGYPNFAGKLLITDNLHLKGNLSVFNSGDDLVNSFAYGLGLKLTNKDSNYWNVSLLFSNLKGPDDIRLKTLDVNIVYDFIIKKILLFAGFGINSYKSKILIDDELIPNIIDGNANHLLVGAFLNAGKFTFVPIFQLNTDVIVMNIEFSRSFK